MRYAAEMMGSLNSTSNTSLLGLRACNQSMALQKMEICTGGGKYLIHPDKQILWALQFDYFLIHWSKHFFWVLKRTVSQRQFFEYQQTQGFCFYIIDKQQRLRWACTYAQSHHSLFLLHTQSMDVEEGSDQNVDL